MKTETIHMCDNCVSAWKEKDLKEIKDYYQRVELGGPIPSGECPKCGALCYPQARIKCERRMNVRNRRRIDLVRGMLADFGGIVGLDVDDDGWDTIITDFLTDLIHMVDAEGLDLPFLLNRAQGHFEEECDDKEDEGIRRSRSCRKRCGFGVRF